MVNVWAEGQKKQRRTPVQGLQVFSSCQVTLLFVKFCESPTKQKNWTFYNSTKSKYQVFLSPLLSVIFHQVRLLICVKSGPPFDKPMTLQCIFWYVFPCTWAPGSTGCGHEARTIHNAGFLSEIRGHSGTQGVTSSPVWGIPHRASASRFP